MESDITWRMATKEDAEEILELYAPYVTDTAITFEYEVPSVQEFAERISNITKKYPYLVAIENKRIIGYAYASAFKERAAYDWAVETSVYLRQDCRGKGVGKKLYLALEEILRQQNILNLNACIAYTTTEDGYLTNGSTYFHNQLGYKKVGHFTKCGYKFNTWYDMIWMEKMIGEHSCNPEPVIPITDLHGL
ncbi:GNAT family N-acetyltransferase [Desulfosporosinus hippei]|uniref:Phosphinothricin acetyltransferase n=1 Tax=Desulfosporosinus hippei DSM 8344 TaxID=1121419 RepID=A0A1G8J872_9FIRM|nr:GNAT family N-acetyltransferase [Desulfosporosinus hippei]SDI26840.1 phosphinothricin acetyltransferase [Desulfosporosinus hippei DSM 8344]